MCAPGALGHKLLIDCHCRIVDNRSTCYFYHYEWRLPVVHATENIEDRGWTCRSHSRVHGNFSIGAASRAMGMTPPTDRSKGRGVTFNLVQDCSAVSGTWDEFSTKGNGGLHRAFAISTDGHWGYSADAAEVSGDKRAAEQRAISICQILAKTECFIYALDNRIVWHAVDGSPEPSANR